jgi:acetyl-CoA carboxylase carboxyltransferase component
MFSCVVYQQIIYQIGLCRSVTVVIVRPDFGHLFYTFPAALEYEENSIQRHLDPALAYQLELERLQSFELQRYPTKADHIHVYYAMHGSDRRFFSRCVVRSTELLATKSKLSMPMAEKTFLEALGVLEDAMTNGAMDFDQTEMNHIFLNLVSTVVAPDTVLLEDLISDFVVIFKRIYVSHAFKMKKLHVTDVEIRVSVKTLNAGITPLRFTLSNPTAHLMQVHAYTEEISKTEGKLVLLDIGSAAGLLAGPYHGLPTDSAYTTLDALQQKRLRASVLGTNYIYDFADIFLKALQTLWRRDAETRRLKGLKRGNTPQTLLRAAELILDGAGNVVEIDRPAGLNRIGMIAWRYTLWTPEYPDGREIIVIANDITVGAGAFGPPEDKLFNAVSLMARKEGLPRIYIAANSGAKIGMAEEVKKCYQVAWNDPTDTSKGFRYIYLKPDDYRRLVRSESAAYKQAGVGNKSVNAEMIFENGEERWKIIDIIGEADGLNQESLAGSGLIAGETSRAYDDVFTLTYVTSRSVGIGAYLVRLGQRVIQKVSNAPIILTGFEALNKVLGRPVYLSNAQLGGIRVMHANGVSHMTVEDDLEGVGEVLRWLAFVPKVKGAALPCIETLDPINRNIEFMPSRSAYDVRDMLSGFAGPDAWVSGFFDEGSWIETLGGWAKNVVTGRARLGGIPLGIIAVETRTVERLLPADPADADTKEIIQQQAGQVWFPDSSFKTANAIADFNREGLPLMIFANWRGFSGGARDMFDEILKFGR